MIGIDLLPPDGKNKNGEKELIDESIIQFSKEFSLLCIKHKLPVSCFFLVKSTGEISAGGHKQFLGDLKASIDWEKLDG